jgi:hypothetical protein
MDSRIICHGVQYSNSLSRKNNAKLQDIFLICRGRERFAYFYAKRGITGGGMHDWAAQIRGEPIELEEYFGPIRTDLLKSLYLSMLVCCPPSTVMDFWTDVLRKHPLPGITSLRDFILVIYAPDQRVPLSFHHHALREAEAFFEQRKMNVQEFFKVFNSNDVLSLVYDPVKLLGWIKPFIGFLYHIRDVRVLILKILDRLSAAFYEQKTHRLVYHHKGDEFHECLTLLSWDHKFHFRIPYGADYWTQSILQVMPVPLGLEPFEHIGIVADSRLPWEIYPQLKLQEHPEGYTLDGEWIALWVKMHEMDFWNKGRVGLHHWAGNIRVLRWQKKLESYSRLQVGVCYGAPFTLFRLKFYKRKKVHGENAVSSLLDWQEGSLKKHTQLEANHKEFLLYCSKRYEYQFLLADDSCLVNGEYLVRGVPARILKYVLSEYLEKGQVRFEHKAVRKQPELFLDPRNPNLEARLQRLMEKLEQKDCGIRLVKSTRGSFSVSVTGRIQIKP